MPLQCRFIEENGTKAWLRVYWGDNCKYEHGLTYHNTNVFLAENDNIRDWSLGGSKEDYPDDRWPTKCDRCGLAVPAIGPGHADLEYSDQIHRQVFRKKRYNTESGLPEPGDIFWADWHHHTDDETGGVICHEWDNCKDPRGHLYAVCPDGTDWDIDGRASNCTKKDDKTHRCWVRSGEPPNVTAGKKGHTCAAGAGSIAVSGYHGFLRNGSFT